LLMLDGCKVKIINKTVSVYDANGNCFGRKISLIIQELTFKGEYASLSDFIRKWKSSDKKEEIRKSFAEMGIDLEALKKDQNMADVDDFDFICYVAYGQKPLNKGRESQ
jgi:type I restriction enzyme R subunit